MTALSNFALNLVSAQCGFRHDARRTSFRRSNSSGSFERACPCAMCRRKASTDTKVAMHVPQMCRVALVLIFESIQFYRKLGRECLHFADHQVRCLLEQEGIEPTTERL